MPSTEKSLWPEKIGVARTPYAVKILREQGEALSNLTEGKLYGDVSPPISWFATSSVVYSFNICVRDRPISHKLLSIECNLLFDDIVNITDHEAEVSVRTQNNEEFREQLKIIFNSETTQKLLSRLLAFADNKLTA